MQERVTLESDEDVQKSREQNVLLDNVRVEAEARPVQADVEITVPVEVIWPEEEVEVADHMDDHEEDQEKRRPRHSLTLALDLDRDRREDGKHDLLQERHHHEVDRSDPAQVGLVRVFAPDLGVVLALAEERRARSASGTLGNPFKAD